LRPTALGIGIGKAFPGFGKALDRVQIVGVSLPIAIGLL
jgi:ACR3 family arsenite efflux pump ArsB